MVTKQPIKLGPRHAGKLVTVIIEDTSYRILHGEEELAVKPRKDTHAHHPALRPRHEHPGLNDVKHVLRTIA